MISIKGRKMPISIKDIAKATGFSASTISRVINNKPGISEETRILVNKAIKRYNYVPNMIARNLINRKTSTIGVVVPDFSEVFFSRIIKGIDAVISEKGFTMILCDSNESAEKEKRLISTLCENQVNGIIIATVQEAEDFYNNCISRTPVVFIDNLLTTNNSFNSVTIDNAKASILAVEHLYKLGHRKIGTIVGKQTESTGRDRYNGYCKALKQLGIEYNEKYVRFGDFKEKSGYESMIDLLENTDITSVYTASSKMTFGALIAMKERKIKIPDRIALVGFDIRDENNIYNPSITTILQPERYIGQVAAQLLLNKIEYDEKSSYDQKVILEPVLSIRHSTVGDYQDDLDVVPNVFE